MRSAFVAHWRDYLIEAFGLGVFMVSAAVFATLLEYHASPLREIIQDPLARRTLMGLAMGLTAVAIIYSPWGKRSGAHINPAVTLTYFRLGRIEAWDAFWYIVFQFLGGMAGVYLSTLAIGEPFTGSEIGYVVTVPGRWGEGWAFVAELGMSFFLMTAILQVSNRENIAHYTGLLAGFLVATFIATEAPISGMSINPARTAASAVPAHIFRAWWIYLTAPVLGMFLAAEVYLRTRGEQSILCAKLQHGTDQPCLFKNCQFKAMKGK